jgi:prevent-host-death family protein
MRVRVSKARSRWGALLRRVSSGETAHITRRGTLVAKLVPVDGGDRVDLKKVVEEIRELRKGASLEKVTTWELIEEGRLLILRPRIQTHGCLAESWVSPKCLVRMFQDPKSVSVLPSGNLIPYTT